MLHRTGPEWRGMHKLLDMHMHGMHDRGMNLGRYLSDNNLTDAAFAGLVGMSQSQINRLRRGLSQPSWETVALIERVTNGEVSASDFMPAPAAPSEQEGAPA